MDIIFALHLHNLFALNGSNLRILICNINIYSKKNIFELFTKIFIIEKKLSLVDLAVSIPDYANNGHSFDSSQGQAFV